jgi:hypothetical protein
VVTDAPIAPPTKSDNAAMRRHLGAHDRLMQACYLMGLDSQRRNPDWTWYGDEYMAWLDGRFERNRRRQERFLIPVCERLRKRFPRVARAIGWCRECRDRRRWDWSPESG